MAQREGYEQSVILGAFLHDIGGLPRFFLSLNDDPPGHLVGMERGLENMKHGGLVLGIGDYNLSFMVT